jgi:tetratricopeptide (TPR) repeat protein
MNDRQTSNPCDRLRTRNWEYAALTALVAILLAPIIYLALQPPGPARPTTRPATFIGSRECGRCHQKIFRKWQQSDHARAMAKATPETVIGDFSNRSFSDPETGVASRFFTRDGRFFVTTEGPAGQPAEFEIAYTFGCFPLQQYLIPFPGGRLQCLNLAWDVKAKRWFRLPPEKVKGPGDWLHWTNRGQTWNSMCAECHSTRVHKGYDPQTDTFRTTWFEIDVGCEACHGPGSRHREWAEKPAFARPARKNAGLRVRTAQLSGPELTVLCAPCHARRFQLGDNRHHPSRLLDLLVPSRLGPGVYFPDGQILGEDYVYGSFVQSKMYRHGVGCSDCHDMHDLKLHAEGNALCTGCHEAEVYDSGRHHFHKRYDRGKPSPGWLCVNCHMPGRTYMKIDFRRDHSLRRPRPDLSRKLKTPNACNSKGCHADKELAWSVKYLRRWYGKEARPHYGEIIAAGRSQEAGAGPALRRLAGDRLKPGIVRATAIDLLENYPGPETRQALTRALEDDDALVRRAALVGLDALPAAEKLKHIAPKLYDPARAVRQEAAFRLTGTTLAKLPPADRKAFRENLADYRQSLLYNSDFPAQRFDLGNLAARLGKSDQAMAYWRQALEIDARFYPAAVNLALEYNRKGDNLKAEKLLRRVVENEPELYDAAYSLGLLLAEMKRPAEAAVFLGRAARGLPGRTRISYNYALALIGLGRKEQAETVLTQILSREPDNPDYFKALANLYLQSGRYDQARQLAESALARNPDCQPARKLSAWLARRHP